MSAEAARRISAALQEQNWTNVPVILLVTADRDLREAAAAALNGRGYRVLAAAHAGHAVLACMDVERVDVAAIELSMDDVSGPVLAERLRRRCPGLKSLYLANAGTPEIDGILVRPFSREQLVERLIADLPDITSAS